MQDTSDQDPFRQADIENNMFAVFESAQTSVKGIASTAKNGVIGQELEAVPTPVRASQPFESSTSLMLKPWLSTFIWICPDGRPHRLIQTRGLMAGRPWLNFARRVLSQTGSKSTSVRDQPPPISMTKNPTPSNHRVCAVSGRSNRSRRAGEGTEHIFRGAIKSLGSGSISE